MAVRARQPGVGLTVDLRERSLHRCMPRAVRMPAHRQAGPAGFRVDDHPAETGPHLGQGVRKVSGVAAPREPSRFPPCCTSTHDGSRSRRSEGSFRSLGFNRSMRHACGTNFKLRCSTRIRQRSATTPRLASRRDIRLRTSAGQKRNPGWCDSPSRGGCPPARKSPPPPRRSRSRRP